MLIKDETPIERLRRAEDELVKAGFTPGKWVEPERGYNSMLGHKGYLWVWTQGDVVVACKADASEFYGRHGSPDSSKPINGIWTGVWWTDVLDAVRRDLCAVLSKFNVQSNTAEPPQGETL